MENPKNSKREELFEEKKQIEPESVEEAVENAKRVKEAAEKAVKEANDAVREAKERRKNPIPDYEHFFDDSEEDE